MNLIKNFSIFKQDNKGNEKLPTHAISTKIGEEYVTIGACWTKDSTKGKFLSCKLQDAWVDAEGQKKARKGFAIFAEKPEVEDHTAIDPMTGEDLNDGSSPF